MSINWDKYNEAMALETAQSQLRDCWADKGGNDTHGRETAASMHEAAAAAHDAAAAAHDESRATPTMHENSNYNRSAARDASIKAVEATHAANDKTSEKRVTSRSRWATTNNALNAMNSGLNNDHATSAHQHRGAAEGHRAQAAQLRGKK